jgi:hypothetical protein
MSKCAPGPRRQGGFAIMISLLIGIILVTVLITSLFVMEQRRQSIDFARIEGFAVSQMATGLRGFITQVQVNPSILTTNPFFRTGVDWLKPESCGGLSTNPPEGFLPCAFTGGTLGRDYEVTIQYDVASNAIEARMTLTAPALSGEPQSPIMVAERMVEAALSQQGTPVTGTFFGAFANVPEAYAGEDIDVLPNALDAGRVLVIVNNAPSNDIFLRVDGSNTMNANLRFSGPQGFSISNARDGQFNGNLSVEGAAQINDGLTVDGRTVDSRGGLYTTDGYVQATGKWMSQAITDGVVLTGDTAYFVPHPVCCPAGDADCMLNADYAIYTAFQSTGSNAAYDALYDARIDVSTLPGGWSVRPRVRGMTMALSTDFPAITLDRTIQEYDAPSARVMVMTKCR